MQARIVVKLNCGHEINVSHIHRVGGKYPRIKASINWGKEGLKICPYCKLVTGYDDIIR